MRRPWLALVLLSFGACDISQQINQAQANHVTVTTLLQSPALPLPDGGTGPSVAVASIYLGTLNLSDLTSGSLNNPPSPTTGEAVTVSDDAGLSAACTELGSGVYQATSADGGLRYDPGAAYTFTLTDSTTSYVATGVAPQAEQVAAFQATFASDGGLPQPVFAQVGVGQDFTLVRSTSPGSDGKLDIAFLTVEPLSNPGSPTWTNAPQSPLDFLKLVANDSQWRTPTVVIPGSRAFPAAGYYLVALTAVKKGGPQSNDLFIGSAVLLGSAVAGVLQVQ